MAVDPKVKERIFKALNFEKPDRPPVWEMIESREVYDHFAPGVPYPECAGITCAKLGLDATYGCYPPPEERARTGGGVIAGQTVWATGPRFRTLDDLQAFRPGKIDERVMEEWILKDHEAHCNLYEPTTMYLPQNGGWGFLPGYDTDTFTVISLAIMEDIGSLERYWDGQMERAIVHNTITARHRLSPVIQCCEDVAYKTGLLISPDVLHQHFFPRFRRVIEPLKAAGIKVIWHSDGDIRAVLDDAISIGIDGIDPLERTAGMDVGSIRRKYGKRLILVGDVDSHVLKSGTEDEVRRTVRECIKAGDADGGHLVQSDAGQIMPDVPVRNVLAYIEEVKKFRVERKS